MDCVGDVSFNVNRSRSILKVIHANCKPGHLAGGQDKKVVLDMKWPDLGPKEGRNVSAHADDEPIRGPKGLFIIISSSRRTRFAAP
jgi:hypothetical protein